MSALIDEIKITPIEDAVAAGTGDTIDSDIVDMQGWDGCLFIAKLGAVTGAGTAVMNLQQGSAANLSDAADLAGSAAAIVAGEDQKVLAIDIQEPDERYLRSQIDRAVANVVIDSVIAIQYRGRSLPPTQDADVASVVRLVRPSEGTP